MSVFSAADILLPEVDSYEDWAVVACDQYSSDPEYWNRIHERLKDAPSTLHLILPEAWLGSEKAGTHQAKIRETMEMYLQEALLKEFPQSYIYVERSLTNGILRRGLVGQLDLEAYDYHSPSKAPIRATEATILERIPARAQIRSDAILEFPHILLLQNDARDTLFAHLKEVKESFPVCYDFDLMENGGHITGRLITGENKAMVDEWVAEYQSRFVDEEAPLYYAVGDGNHSLAAAKAIWETLKETLEEEEQDEHPARFALAELENLQDDAQQFEPIHRILKHVDWKALLDSMEDIQAKEGYSIEWVAGNERGTIVLDSTLSPLPLAILQKHLDAWLAENEGEIDYIHGEAELETLAQEEGSIGFFLPAISKDSLFETILKDGALPRKTFSMGHAHEKRYYLEGKKLIRS